MKFCTARFGVALIPIMSVGISMLAPRELVAPLITFGDDARAARIAQEHSKLSRSLTNYVSTRSALVPLGPDPVVQQLLSAKGFTKYDSAILRVGAKGQSFTAIAVPTRIWRDVDTRPMLFKAKSEAAAEGIRCLLIPQRWLRAGVRSQVARTLALSHRVRIRRSDLEAVLDYIGCFRMATLSQCASHIAHQDDPVGVVLALCAKGYLWIDRTQPISLSSWVASAI